MRETLAAALAALVLATAGATAQDAPPQIAVTGSGEVRVSPDMAVLTLGTLLRGETAEAVLEAVADSTAALLEALEDSGIAAEDVQTRRAALRPVFAEREAGDTAPVPVGFESESLLEVHVRDLAVLSAVYGAASEAGATRFDGLRFELSDPADALAEARAAAVADARLRAETYAGAAGVSLGPIIAMSEPGSGPAPVAFRAAAAEMADMPIAPGSLTVSARVNIVYALTE